MGARVGKEAKAGAAAAGPPPPPPPGAAGVWSPSEVLFSDVMHEILICPVGAHTSRGSCRPPPRLQLPPQRLLARPRARQLLLLMLANVSVAS